MWAIEYAHPSHNGGHVVVSLRGSHIVVARRDGDVVFPNDNSVSRKHAQLQVSSEGVFIIDSKSSFGTYVNGERIAPHQRVPLASEDCLKFGNDASAVVLRKLSFKFCPTRLDKSEKDRLKKMAKAVGAVIVKSIDDCTHLFCNKFSATVKTLTAIVMRKPIVNLQWLESFALPDGVAVTIPDTMKFCPDGTSVMTPPSILMSPRDNLLQKFVVLIPHVRDEQYRSILTHCGAEVYSLYVNNNTAGDLEVEARRLLSTCKDRDAVVFLDECYGPDVQTTKLVQQLRVSFLGSGDLATAVFRLTPPVLITNGYFPFVFGVNANIFDIEMLSQRALSQYQSQMNSQSNMLSQIHACGEPEPKGYLPEENCDGFNRSTTLVQSEVINACEDCNFTDEEGHKEKVQTKEIIIEEKSGEQLPAHQAEGIAVESKEVSDQAPLREMTLKKEIEEEEFNFKGVQCVGDDKRLPKEEYDRQIPVIRYDEDEAHIHFSHAREKEVATKKCDTSMDAGDNIPRCRLKRSIGNVEDCIRAKRSKPDQSLAEDYQDLPQGLLIDVECSGSPSDGNGVVSTGRPQPDADGWISLSCHSSGYEVSHTLIGDERCLEADPECSSSNTYMQPVVIEKTFQLRTPVSGSIGNANSSDMSWSSKKDNKRFKKNIVRRVSGAPLRLQNMVRVLPKESEREILLRQNYEQEAQSLADKDTLFSDRVKSAKKTQKRLFGF